MNQRLYRLIPPGIRQSARPLYHHARARLLPLQLRHQWRAARRTPATAVFPVVRDYSLSTRAYFKRHHNSAAYIPLADETYFSPPPPKTIGNNALAHQNVPTNSPLFAARLQNARVFGEVADVVTADNTLLVDVSFLRPSLFLQETQDHPFLNQPTLAPTRPLRGTYALLASLYAGVNHFHWLFNCLPRLALLERANIPRSTLDGFLINRLELPVTSEMVRMLDLPASALIEIDRNTTLSAESLWVFPSLRNSGHRRRFICDWLRAHFLPPSLGKPTRRLYISREDAAERRMSNEHDLIEILTPLGFETITLSNRSITEQAALFAQAEIVLAPHSAALANLVFSSPGTRVLDIMPADRLRTYYWELSACMGLDYYYCYSQPDPNPAPHRANRFDTVLPPNQFRALLKLMQIT